MIETFALLPMLFKGTMENKLIWVEAGETGVAVVLGQNTISIDWYVDDENDTGYTIDVRDRHGKIVESQTSFGGETYKLLYDTHRLARRVVTGTDRIIEDLMHRLESIVGMPSGEKSR